MEGTPTFAEELVERGRTHLESAIEAFTAAAAGPDPTILDVTAETAEFSRFEVNEAYRAAREDLAHAGEYATGATAKEVEALLEVAEFVDTLGLAQTHLVNSHRNVTIALRSFYTESYGEFPGEVENVAEQHERAAGRVATIQETYDESTVEPVDSITREQFGAKMEQVDRELLTIDAIATSTASLADGIGAFEDDVGEYAADRYEGVGFRTEDFETARDALATVEPAASLQTEHEELTCLLDSLYRGTNAMQRAVLARRNGDDAAEGYERDARAEYEACDRLVSDVAPVADLLDSLAR